MAEGSGDEKVSGSTPVVFISYASQDAAVANSIVENLEQHKIGCWIAPRDVVPGSLYAEGIVRAINGAKAIVLVLSEHAVASAHVAREVERGCAKKKKIIPFKTDQCSLSLSLEYFLSGCHSLSARRSEMESALGLLVSAVQQCIAATWSAPFDRSSAAAEAAEPDEEGRCILAAVWNSLDSNLQDAFSIAYNKKRREGSRRISTKDFFQALRRMDNDSIAPLLNALPDSALPEPASCNVDANRALSVSATTLLSDCVWGSLHRFGNLVSVPRKLTSTDLFVDIAKRGHGPSVERLRKHGVGPAEISAAVERLRLDVIDPC